MNSSYSYSFLLTSPPTSLHLPHGNARRHAQKRFQQGEMQKSVALAEQWLHALVSPKAKRVDLKRAANPAAVCEIACSLIEKARENAIQEYRLQVETRAALGKSNRTMKRLKVFGSMGLPNTNSDMLLDEAIQRLEEVMSLPFLSLSLSLSLSLALSLCVPLSPPRSLTPYFNCK